MDGQAVAGMDDCVWVGPEFLCPAGWSTCESVPSLLTLPVSPRVIGIDDPAAVLRESDFARLFSCAPLARIERVIGPWRAGVGRTDPQWPLATTLREVPLGGLDSIDGLTWSPLTSSYDDLATEAPVVDLAGTRFGIQISDVELREMWADWLTLSGGELSNDRVDVLIRDTAVRDTLRFGDAIRCLVMLSPAPWNAVPGDRGSRSEIRQESAPPHEITVSVLDSPSRIMQRVMAAIERVAS